MGDLATMIELAKTREPGLPVFLPGHSAGGGEVQPASTVAALVRADERLEKEFGRITLPVLIMRGTVGKATVPSGSEYFYRRAGSPDKTLRLYEGHYHDLFNDYGKEELLMETRQWIRGYLPAARQPGLTPDAR